MADLVVLNGLNLELPILELAEANVAAARILLLGDNAIGEEDYVFDVSFPNEQGNPNPHLWTTPNLSLRYADLVRDALSVIDPVGAGYYSANWERYRAQLDALDAAIVEATATIPEANRKLLTYHDSFPIFGPRYGFEVIGAIRPSTRSTPGTRGRVSRASGRATDGSAEGA